MHPSTYVCFSSKGDLHETIEQLKSHQEVLVNKLKKQRSEIEQNLKTLLEQLLKTSNVYDELIQRKESKLYYETLNDKVRYQGGMDGWMGVTCISQWLHSHV